MRKILMLLGLSTVMVLSLSRAANAGFVIEGSVGKGVKVAPKPVAATQSNLMVAPGVELLSLLRLQLGIVGELPDIKESKFDLGLRPMVTLAPPILPLYGRVVLAVSNLLDSEKRHIAYGPVLGVKFGLFGIGIFAEAGLLPRNIKVMDTKQFQWVIEGRLGAFISF